jgi:type III secretion protein C
VTKTTSIPVLATAVGALMLTTGIAPPRSENGSISILLDAAAPAYAATPPLAVSTPPVPPAPQAAPAAPSRAMSSLSSGVVPSGTSGAVAGATIVARDQPIGDFLRDLFGRTGRPVVPSPGLTGTVNGTFTGSVDHVFDQVARAFNLVGYDDGAAFYVYTAHDMGVQTIPAGPAIAQKVLAEVQAQRLGNARNVVRAAADGNLVASGTPRFIEQVSAMARAGAAPAPVAIASRPGMPVPPPPTSGQQPLEFRVFYLRYARAEDTTVDSGGREVRIPGLATTLQDLVLDRRGPGAKTPTFGSFPIRQSQGRLKGFGLDAVAPNGSQTPILGLPIPGVTPGTAYPGAADYLGQPQLGADSIVAPLTQDIVRIEPEPYLNAVVVRDVPERMAAYDSLIRALDVEPQLVEVEATIIDINTDKLKQLGINWRFNAGGVNALFGSGPDADGNTGADSALTRIDGSSRRNNALALTPSAQGLSLSTIIGSHREFISRITALENRGAARIVSRPQVMTLGNVEAVFDRTRTFYVKVAGREQVDLFNVTAGTILRVNPHVFRDHDQTRIRMLVNIEDGSISPTSMVQNIPIVDRSSVSTQAMVTDGESLLLGGMTIDEDLDNEMKIPVLGDIPLLGNLFKVKSRSRGHTERLFLITPRLATLNQRATTQVSQTSTPATPMAPIATEKLQ